MEPARFSVIGHSGMALCNPLSSENVDLVVDALRLEEGARVVDVGCGKGEILIRVLERWPAAGIGIDLSPSFLDEARRRASERVPGADIEWLERDATAFDPEPAAFDLTMSVGSAWLLGDLPKALDTMRRWTKSGGLVLVGEGYWMQVPTSEYLELLGASADDYGSHEDNIEAGATLGLEPLYACVTSRSDWDRYEWTYFSNIERWARANIDDPERDSILERGRLGRERYLRGGRDALGFGLYLFRV
jgi:ubiquinone/menaquinone biosynthesis C-methylase UbiE